MRYSKSKNTYLSNYKKLAATGDSQTSIKETEEVKRPKTSYNFNNSAMQRSKNKIMSAWGPTTPETAYNNVNDS